MLATGIGRIVWHSEIAIAAHDGFDVCLAQGGCVGPGVVVGAYSRHRFILALTAILLLLFFNFKYFLECFKVWSTIASEKVVANYFMELAISLNFQLSHS